MYVRTREVLGQVPTFYRSFAGVLGEPPLPREIQDFLERVKKNPQDYEAVLLTATLHMEPWRSDLLSRLLGIALSATNSIDEAQPMLEKILQTLEDIQKKHLRNNQFSQLVRKEKQLIPVVASAFQKGIKEIETRYPKWYEQILAEAALAPDPTMVGKKFVLFSFPLEIAQRVTNSRVPETHYVRVGKALFLIAEQRQKDNASFKERVERERKKQEE
jgi:hypothetical protein